MITGNTAWEEKLAAAQKRPLYVLQLDYWQIGITSFDLAEAGVTTTGGYGVAYGTSYGSD